MDDQTSWISAYDALEMLAEEFNPITAMHTICERAHAGLIRAKAELFKIDDKEFEIQEVPRKFWWAKGDAALKQNWRAGDFSTWIDHKYHWQVFGVTFAEPDIQKLLLTTKPKRHEPQLTEEDRKIEERLKGLVPAASKSWRQAILDLNDASRVSFRGTALEMREALRETLDKLAPDDAVENSVGYKREQDRTGPTQKQKVRFIMKQKNKSSREVAEGAIVAFEDSIANLTRSVYTRSSKSTHSSSEREEVVQLRRYMVAVLHDILDI